MPAPAIEAGELFDHAFLESLNNLRIVARRVARGGRFAEQRSRDMGSGIEFQAGNVFGQGFGKLQVGFHDPVRQLPSGMGSQGPIHPMGGVFGAKNDHRFGKFDFRENLGGDSP